MRRLHLGFFVLAGLILGSATVATQAADQSATAEQLRFFETKIRPLLAEHCYKCHGNAKQEANFRLDSLSGLLRGGDRGTALVPGDPKKSRLIRAVSYKDEKLKMPPKARLSDAQIADLVRWVKMGSPHPDVAGQPRKSRGIDIEAGRKFWSFQRPLDPQVPGVKNADWATSDLDRFILARLEQAGLEPAPSADKRTLIRRATFDLIGLPPTPAEVSAFLKDDSADAFAKVVDRLLESPHYGERWGRHWLDVARYADSNGLDENIAHGNAWRYRDYVVAAFNKDKPFDQFIVEQLAGDLLPTTDDVRVRHERLIATGFLSLGPKVLAEVDQTKMEMDIIDEQIDTLGRSLLGLTLGCARCHDHKFDPINNEDYYALAGIFKSTRTMEHYKKIARWWENPIDTQEDRDRKAAHDALLTQKKDAIQKVVDDANVQLKAAAGSDAKLPKDPETQYPKETKAELKRLRGELAALKKATPELPTAMGVGEREVTDLRVHVRGSHLALGELVPRRVPEVFAGPSAPTFTKQQSGRLELARWLTRPDHPLTGRVMVNRIWRGHFGRGLVATTENFGSLGERPSHPQLLDWLVHRFVENGWSMKAMHRLIMLSSTYRMSGRYNAQAAEVDPENRLHWRMSVRRLEAEAIRDSLLAVSGQLDKTMGGSMLHVKNREFFFDHTSKDGTKYDSTRRSIYLPVVRNNLYDVFQLFDYSDASVLNGHRGSSTVAPQALFMMNSDLVAEMSRAIAASLLTEKQLDDKARVRLLYEKCYGRPPSSQETNRSLAFLGRFHSATQNDSAEMSRQEAWSMLCHVALAANEFIYVK